MSNEKSIIVSYYFLHLSCSSYSEKLCLYLDLLINNDSFLRNIEHYFIELLSLEGILTKLTELQRMIIEYKRQKLNYADIAVILSITDYQVKKEYELSINYIKDSLRINRVN